MSLAIAVRTWLAAGLVSNNPASIPQTTAECMIKALEERNDIHLCRSIPAVTPAMVHQRPPASNLLSKAKISSSMQNSVAKIQQETIDA